MGRQYSDYAQVTTYHDVRGYGVSCEHTRQVLRQCERQRHVKHWVAVAYSDNPILSGNALVTAVSGLAPLVRGHIDSSRRIQWSRLAGAAPDCFKTARIQVGE